VRRHDHRDPLWRECWHDHDRADAHTLGRHHWCLPGDALPLPLDDPHGEHGDTGTGPDACRWAALWRAPVLALAGTLPPALPLGVVALDPARGPVPVSAHESYRTAGPTRVGRRPGDETMAEAKSRAVVVCSLGHILVRVLRN
jgi:hypothetical protein